MHHLYEYDNLSLKLRYRERDSTSQLIGPIDTVISVVDELVKGTIDWEGASGKLEAYSGVQAVEE